MARALRRGFGTCGPPRHFELQQPVSRSVPDVTSTTVEVTSKIARGSALQQRVLRPLALGEHDPAQRDQLRAFLERCDLVKFAGASLTTEESREMLQIVRVFVQTSEKPVPA